MKSGIYRLKFGNGDTYIGKSKDILRRWGEHADRLKSGTASTLLQQAYYASKWVLPEAEVLVYCHEDYLDILEATYIAREANSINVLRPTPRNVDVILSNPEYLEKGIDDLILEIKRLEVLVNRPTIVKEVYVGATALMSQIHELEENLLTVAATPWWKHMINDVRILRWIASKFGY